MLFYESVYRSHETVFGGFNQIVRFVTAPARHTGLKAILFYHCFFLLYPAFRFRLISLPAIRVPWVWPRGPRGKKGGGGSRMAQIRSCPSSCPISHSSPRQPSGRIATKLSHAAWLTPLSHRPSTPSPCQVRTTLLDAVV